MNNKTILLSAFFMGLITMDKAEALTHAHCPATIDENQYQQLLLHQEVEHCTLEHVHGGFIMGAGNTASFAANLVDEDEEKCPYLLNQQHQTPYAQFTLRCPRGG